MRRVLARQARHGHRSRGGRLSGFRCRSVRVAPHPRTSVASRPARICLNRVPGLRLAARRASAVCPRCSQIRRRDWCSAPRSVRGRFRARCAVRRRPVVVRVRGRGFPGGTAGREIRGCPVAVSTAVRMGRARPWFRRAVRRFGLVVVRGRRVCPCRVRFRACCPRPGWSPVLCVPVVRVRGRGFPGGTVDWESRGCQMAAFLVVRLKRDRPSVRCAFRRLWFGAVRARGVGRCLVCLCQCCLLLRGLVLGPSRRVLRAVRYRPGRCAVPSPRPQGCRSSLLWPRCRPALRWACRRVLRVRGSRRPGSGAPVLCVLVVRVRGQGFRGGMAGRGSPDCRAGAWTAVPGAWDCRWFRCGYRSC